MRTTRLISIPAKRPGTSTAFNRNKVPESFQEIFNQIPHLDNVDIATLYERSKERLRDEEYFDNVMSRCNSLPLFEAFESILEKMFQCDRAILWENRPETHDYHSNKFDKEIGISNPIIQDIISSKQILILDSIKDANLADQFLTSPDLPQLFFPLYLNNGEIIAIIQLTKNSPNIPFDSSSEERSRFISRKFSIYGGPSFAQPRMILYASELSHYGSLKATVDLISKSIKSKFGCQCIDFWYFNETMNLFSRYESGSGFVNVYRCKSGIIGQALRTKTSINETACKNNPNYLPNIDGDPENPILIVCYPFDGKIWACALRGPRSSYMNLYCGEDEKHLLTLMPFISRSLSYSSHMSQPPPTPTDKIEESISKTLKISIELSSLIELDKIINFIEQQFSVLLECERVNVLLVNSSQTEFLTSSKRLFPINECLSGLSFTSQKASIYKNPTANEKFNHDVDIACDNLSEVRNILSFPLILNNNCIAVINFINKIDGKLFSASDIDRFNQFASFCTCSLHNAMLNQSALSIPCKLQILDKDKNVQLSTIKNLLETIFESAKETFSVSFVTLFLKDDTKYYEFLSVGKTISNNLIEMIQEKNKTMTIFKNSTFFSATSLIDYNQNVFGVLEIGGDAIQCQENIELIESFISISGSLLEQLCIEKVVEIGKEYESFKQLIEVKYRNSYDTPLVLKIGNSNLFVNNFDINQCPENDYFKIIFKAFDTFALKSIFRISNQTLHFFLVEVFKYHQNIKRTIDDFQFLVSSILTTHLDGKLSTVELLSLLISSLLHQNEQEIKKTKRQQICDKVLKHKIDVNSIKSIEFLSKTISKQECNIFLNIKNNKSQQIWKLIIKLMKSINIRKHFKYVNQFIEIVKSEKFAISENDNRILLIIILLKNSMFGALTRDFNSCQTESLKIVDTILNRNIDLTSCDKLKYDSENIINKEKSIIPILNYFVLPSFTSVSVLYPSYNTYIESIQSNFAKIRRQQIESGIEEEEKHEEEINEENQNSIELNTANNDNDLSKSKEENQCQELNAAQKDDEIENEKYKELNSANNENDLLKSKEEIPHEELNSVHKDDGMLNEISKELNANQKENDMLNDKLDQLNSMGNQNNLLKSNEENKDEDKLNDTKKEEELTKNDEDKLNDTKKEEELTKNDEAKINDTKKEDELAKNEEDKLNDNKKDEETLNVNPIENEPIVNTKEKMEETALIEVKDLDKEQDENQKSNSNENHEENENQISNHKYENENIDIEKNVKENENGENSIENQKEINKNELQNDEKEDQKEADKKELKNDENEEQDEINNNDNKSDNDDSDYSDLITAEDELASDEGLEDDSD